jgi:transposase
MPRKKYTPEFKREAVQLARDAERAGKSVDKIASGLGVHPNTLREWVRRDVSAKAGTGESTVGLDEREELLQLRKDNRILRMERDILKKAAAHSTGQRTYAGLRGRGWSHHEAARSPGHVVQGEGGAVAPLEGWRIAQ